MNSFLFFLSVSILIFPCSFNPDCYLDIKFSTESNFKIADLDKASEIINKRLLFYGVKSTHFNLAVSNDSLEFKIDCNELDYSKKEHITIDTLRKLLTIQGKLELWEMYDDTVIITLLKKACINISERALTGMGSSNDTSISGDVQFGGLYFNPYEGPVIGYANKADTMKINHILTDSSIKRAFPSKIKFMWSAFPLKEYQNAFMLYALKPVNNNKASIGGDFITEAKEVKGFTGGEEVVFTMTEESAKEFQELTAKNINKYIAVSIDREIYSAPRVNSEISGGRCSIQGQFTKRQALYLAAILNGGMLPLVPHLESEININKLAKNNK